MSFDPRPYAEGIRRQNDKEREDIAKRHKDAMVEARRVAEEIKRHDPEVRSVILFGSVARGEPTRLDFDIDLALDGGDAYRAMDITMDSAFHVDVVELRLLPERVRERIAREGIRL